MSVSTGAIGSVEYDPVSDRFKGFWTQVPETVEGVSVVIRTAVLAGMMRGQEVRDTCRFTMRMFVGPGVRRQDLRLLYEDWMGVPLMCEAFIPISGDSRVGGLAYFGGNRSLRRTAGRDVAQQWEMCARVSDAVRFRTTARAPSGHMQLESMDVGASDADVSQLVELYGVCYRSYMTVFTWRTVRSMLAENIVGIVRDKRSGQIVSVGMAEVATISVGPDDWHVVELTEMATHPEFGGQGLSQRIRHQLVREVRERFGQRVVILSESRANWPAVVKANLILGMRVAGLLDQAAVISSNMEVRPQDGKYGSLFVLYLPVVIR